MSPLSCCGAMSGHTHTCFLVSDRARPPAPPACECSYCKPRTLKKVEKTSCEAC